LITHSDLLGKNWFLRCRDGKDWSLTLTKEFENGVVYKPVIGNKLVLEKLQELKSGLKDPLDYAHVPVAIYQFTRQTFDFHTIVNVHIDEVKITESKYYTLLTVDISPQHLSYDIVKSVLTLVEKHCYEVVARSKVVEYLFCRCKPLYDKLPSRKVWDNRGTEPNIAYHGKPSVMFIHKKDVSMAELLAQYDDNEDIDE